MNAVNSILQPEQRQSIDAILKTHGDLDYKWIDPPKFIVAQWVRMKCMFGFDISVRTDYDQKMDRFAFLMIR
ncbi:MAG: hypothetical protein QNI89_18725 [Desulfobacterales bacterium]|nr:hypothetical protein [Desulfobacterales bacterium]MDJ0889340.1 hypothetical protein [Desulfobacterales bacterium]